jgi:hypothetical protein
MVTHAEAVRIKDAFSAQRLGRDGVSAVGVGQDDSGAPVLVVHLDVGSTDAASGIPDAVEGLPVRIEWTGPFHKQSS